MTATVKRPASDGAIIFHDRPCVMGAAGASSSAGSPPSYTSSPILDAVTLDEVLPVRLAPSHRPI
jgi:hypothetical protein